MTTRFTTRHGDTQETGKHRDKQSWLPDVKDSDYSQQSRAWMRSSNDETRTQTILEMALFCLLLQHKNMLDSRPANKIWKIPKVAEKGSWLINSSGWTDHNGPPLSWFATSGDSSVFVHLMVECNYQYTVKILFSCNHFSEIQNIPLYFFASLNKRNVCCNRQWWKSALCDVTKGTDNMQMCVPEIWSQDFLHVI